MTDYNRSEAYDLSLFAEPAIEPTPEPQRRQQPVRQPKPKQAPHSRTAHSASLRRVLGIFAVSIMLIGLFGGIIAMRISLESLTSEAATLRNKISVAESENVRLTMQLSSAFSREKVEAYAVSQLGMCKLERYQIHYFSDRDGSDKVVVANGKEVKGSAQADATD